MTLSVRLRHAYPGFSLDVSFDAPPGLTVLFGRSGSGKTTVINAIAGLLRPDQGHVSLGGSVLLDTDAGLALPPRARRIGYVFQDGRLFPHLSVARNLDYGRRVQRRAADPAATRRVTELLGIGALLDRRPGALSGGEKQRVAIGRALLSAPDLLLMDEPLAALDDRRKSEILPYLERLRDEMALPIVYVSHALPEVTRLATTLVHLEAGRVTACGPLAEVLSDPETAVALGSDDVGAVLDAVVQGDAGDGLTQVSVPGGVLLLALGDPRPGTRMRIRIRAADVMISREAPQGLSALNILPVRVTRLVEGPGAQAMVQLALGEARILARVTLRSVSVLGLAPGTPCHAIIKSVALAAPESPTGTPFAKG